MLRDEVVIKYLKFDSCNKKVHQSCSPYKQHSLIIINKTICIYDECQSKCN